MDTKELKAIIEQVKEYRKSLYPKLNKLEGKAFDVAGQATDNLWDAIKELEKAAKNLEAGFGIA